MPDKETFSLEEILAELSGGVAKSWWKGDTIPFPVTPRSQRMAPSPTGPPGLGKVVSFPSGWREDPPPVPPPQPEPGEPPEDGDKVLEFPGEEGPAPDSPTAEGFNHLFRRADDYTGHMFEEEGKEDDEEVHRAEEYIPGADEEEPEEVSRERRPHRQPPLAPDLPAAELARQYGKGLKFMGARSVLMFLLLLPALYLTLGPFPYPAVLTPELRVPALAGIQEATMPLGLDVLMRGLLRLLRLELGMDTLLAFATAATLADALAMYRLDPRDGQMPCCAAIVLGIFFLLRGARRKRRGLRMARRTAASAAQPYLVTLDEGKWNGWDTYAKWSGEPVGFDRQMRAVDKAEQIFHRVCPLLFVTCLLLGVVASIGRGAPERLLWCLSAMPTAYASLSGALYFALPWLSLTQRLSKSGTTIAGWDEVTATGGSGILLDDTDFFPPGCVSLNGIKIFEDFLVDKVVSGTATLIRDAGCRLDKLFRDLLRAQGCVYRRASDFCVYEGGLSAVIRNQRVLVGSASFMYLMEITLPQGLNMKNAVFCIVDGELTGIFTLNYTLHGALEPSLNSLIHNRVTPVMATRDFSLIPAILRQRFKLPVDKMEFPAVERRWEPFDEEQPHSDTLTTVLCREEVTPYSEAVVGAARLRRVVRTAAVLACLGTVAGLLLVPYLTSVCSYVSLSVANLLVFLLMWLVPAPPIAGMVNKY